jgi:hypothetical protein
VICTIRTAFLPEAFKEQLQKQIAAAVAEVIAAERKKRHQTRKRPLLHPCPEAEHILQRKAMLIFSSQASVSQLHQEK